TRLPGRSCRARPGRARPLAAGGGAVLVRPGLDPLRCSGELVLVERRDCGLELLNLRGARGRARRDPDVLELVGVRGEGGRERLDVRLDLVGNLVGELLEVLGARAPVGRSRERLCDRRADAGESKAVLVAEDVLDVARAGRVG